MIVIKNNNSKYDIKLVYGESKSRPSKSLLTPGLYKKKDTVIPFDIYEKLLKYQLKEVTGYYKRDSNESIDKHTTSTDFPSIIKFINENKESIFYKLNDLHSIVNIEFILLTSSVFKKLKVYFSKFDYSIFVFCKDRIDQNIDTQIDKNKYLKSFGIDVPKELQDQIKNINDSIFINEIGIKTRILNDMSLTKTNYILKDIKLITNYYLSYIKELDITNNMCNCDSIFNSEILNCGICEKCYSLYSEDSFFLSALSLDHAAAASANAFL
jgi:hypothetical protein